MALTSAQFAAMTTDQVAVLSTAQLVAMETTDVAALKTEQVAALTTTQVAALTTTEVQALKTAQVVALGTDQIQALNTAQVVALSTAQFAGMTVGQVASLTTDQIAAMETTDLAALKTTQIAVLTTDQIVALTTTEVQALKTSQVTILSTDQLQALTMTQVAAMTVAQTNALTTTQQSYLTAASPLILDLNGDGVSTLSFTEGVKFDLFADGRSVHTGWVSSSDGLLVLDRNQDGQITDGSELFGTSTRLGNGATAQDGYAALRELDSNADGVIDSRDARFADLRVWVDSNSDATSQATELKTLSAAGVASISLQNTADLSKDNGNLVALTSTYQTTDGSTRAAADVWFVADKSAAPVPATTTATVDSAIAALNVPVMQTSFATQYVSLKSTEIPAAAPSLPPVVSAAVVPVVEEKVGDIRASVSSLAQAISAFDAIATNRANDSATADGKRTPAAAATDASLTVAGMVDVMKRFDNNGNALLSTGHAAVDIGKSLNLPGVADSVKNGMLAGSGG